MGVEYIPPCLLWTLVTHKNVHSRCFSSVSRDITTVLYLLLWYLWHPAYHLSQHTHFLYCCRRYFVRLSLTNEAQHNLDSSIACLDHDAATLFLHKAKTKVILTIFYNTIYFNLRWLLKHFFLKEVVQKPRAATEVGSQEALNTRLWR